MSNVNISQPFYNLQKCLEYVSLKNPEVEKTLLLPLPPLI